MPNPSTAITRFDHSLSYGEFSLRANQLKFIGLQVLPGIAVAMQSSDFLRVNVESALTKPISTERAPRAAYKRSDFEWTKDSYVCADHGAEQIVDDEDIDRYGDIFRAEGLSRDKAINDVLQSLEQDIADAVFNTTTWTGDALTTAVGTVWTDRTNSVPRDNIEAASDKVEDGCGQEANTLILSKKRFRDLIRSAQIEDLLKYDAAEVLTAMSTGQNQQLVTTVMGGLHEMFQLERILIGRANKNTADEGQAASFSRFWNETMAMVCRISDDGLQGDLQNPEPSIGRTIFWMPDGESLPGSSDDTGSIIVEEYREEQRRGGVIRARNHRQPKILHVEAGHLLTGLKV